MPVHTVRQGECILSIADHYGHHPDDIWEHADNAQLRETRDSPAMLKPGDALLVPDIESQTIHSASGKEHVFRCERVLAKLKLRLMNEREPQTPVQDRPTEKRADGTTVVRGHEPAPYHPEPQTGLAYRLDIDGEEWSRGSTAGDGTLEEAIPPNARKGLLVIEPDTPEERALSLDLGGLDPPDTIAGMKHRLLNLGYDAGELDDSESGQFHGALAAFERDNDREHDGQVNAAVQQALVQAHGS